MGTVVGTVEQGLDHVQRVVDRIHGWKGDSDVDRLAVAVRDLVQVLRPLAAEMRRVTEGFEPLRQAFGDEEWQNRKGGL